MVFQFRTIEKYCVNVQSISNRYLFLLTLLHTKTINLILLNFSNMLEKDNPHKNYLYIFLKKIKIFLCILNISTYSQKLPIKHIKSKQLKKCIKIECYCSGKGNICKTSLMQLRVVQHYILLLEFNAFIQLQILLLLMSCLQTCYLFLLSNFHNQMHTMYHDITSLFYCLLGNIHIMKVNISISCIRMAMSYKCGKV